MEFFEAELKVVQEFIDEADIEFIDAAMTDKAWAEAENAKTMRAGKRNDGSEIKPAYTRYTVKLKKAEGAPFDRVTLEDTGDFHNSITIERSDIDLIEFFGYDIKTGDLLAKYGKDVLGITSDQLEAWGKRLLPLVVDSLRAKLKKA